VLVIYYQSSNSLTNKLVAPTTAALGLLGWSLTTGPFISLIATTAILQAKTTRAAAATASILSALDNDDDHDDDVNQVSRTEVQNT
jgi:hypothetical protein